MDPSFLATGCFFHLMTGTLALWIEEHPASTGEVEITGTVPSDRKDFSTDIFRWHRLLKKRKKEKQKYNFHLIRINAISMKKKSSVKLKRHVKETSH